MKILLIIGCLISAYFFNQSPKIQIDLYNSDYSNAFSIHYKVVGDNLTIERIGGLVGETPVVLFKNKFSKTQYHSLLSFLNSKAFARLRNSYINSGVDDGDQKSLTILNKGKVKKIRIANVYEASLANLFLMINDAVPDKKLQIRYGKQ